MFMIFVLFYGYLLAVPSYVCRKCDNNARLVAYCPNANNIVVKLQVKNPTFLSRKSNSSTMAALKCPRLSMKETV